MNLSGLEEVIPARLMKNHPERVDRARIDRATCEIVEAIKARFAADWRTL